MKVLFEDSILDNSAYIALGTLPFWLLGSLGVAVLWWTWIIIGGLAFLTFIARLITVLSTKKSVCMPGLDSGTRLILGFSFPVAVCSGIMENMDNSGDIFGFCFALFLFIIGLAMAFVSAKKTDA